ncbi:bifunctional riboflavin kinase/FAD synthetase [Aquipuribacter sp. SD81]|uniref:bifunctional riboflavin kinase/FAD synthetase n=1 Tax=Aquipuribacter sp. SD81 TaxID=3127703 RepID=UPI003018FDD2
MRVWRSLEELRGDGPARAVVTVGNFDGVHRGHRAVLDRVRAEAETRGAEARAVTFEPHPLHVLRPDVAPPLVTGPTQRVELLGTTGLDGLLVQRFDLQLAAQSPEQWVRETLVEGLGAVCVVIGVDVRFGHRNAGDLATLRELGQRHGFDVVALEDVAGPAGRRWSSSWVRTCLAEGGVREAADVLGRLHRLDGVVVHGDHRGRELGYPTANLSPEPGATEGLVPADGVYAGWLTVEPDSDDAPGERLPTAVSIGTNPQFDGTQRRVEAYVLDRGPDGFDLYGRAVRVELVERLRPTVRFESVTALTDQMALDVDRTRELLAARPATGANPAGR